MSVSHTLVERSAMEWTFAAHKPHALQLIAVCMQNVNKQYVDNIVGSPAIAGHTSCLQSKAKCADLATDKVCSSRTNYSSPKNIAQALCIVKGREDACKAMPCSAIRCVFHEL